MPPELLELYGLYQQELASRNEKEANYLTELNVMLRVRTGPQMLTWYHPRFVSSPPRCCHWEGRNLMTDLLRKMGSCLQFDKMRTRCSRGRTTETPSTCGPRAEPASRVRKGEGINKKLVWRQNNKYSVECPSRKITKTFNNQTRKAWYFHYDVLCLHCE